MSFGDDPILSNNFTFRARARDTSLYYINDTQWSVALSHFDGVIISISPFIASPYLLLSVYAVLSISQELVFPSFHFSCLSIGSVGVLLLVERDERDLNNRPTMECVCRRDTTR